jgi:GT2 family glycosyltransferase
LRRKSFLLQTATLEKRSKGAWNRIALRISGLDEATVLYATLHDGRGESLKDNLYFQRPASSGGRSGAQHLICFIPPETVEVRLFAVGPAAAALRAENLTFRPLARALVAAYLLGRASRGSLTGLMRIAAFRPGMLRRQIRQLLATTAYEAQIPRQHYATWLTLFDHWSADEFPPRPTGPSITYLVFAREQPSEALGATLLSLEAQWGGATHVVLDAMSGVDLRQVVEGLDADYIGILQAGEVLPPHATQLAAEQIDRLGRPELAIVDEDEITTDGTRHSPSFKPTPNHALMLSGSLSRGLWLVRCPTLLRHAPPAADWAEALRLALWMGRQEFRQAAGAGSFSERIPFILTHRRPDAEAAPPALLAAIIEHHLQRGELRIAPIPTWPLTFRLQEGRADERITVIVPSTLRQPHSLSCIRAILEGTDYPHLDLHVAVMQPGELDAQQSAAADALRRYPNATVTRLEAERFNFSAVNNRIAARTTSDHILLLNDDVTPIRRDWLRWMAAFLKDAGTGIVGARLLYPDGRVQHGGVIMGLSGLCDHAHRYLPGTDPGYMSRAILAQELSAVTAACMLVRRSLFERVGGLDESYPSAFNDVDFALRVGETGHSIIYAPQAELHHHELQTYGSHYAGERHAFQAEEVSRMRQRWSEVCKADPFHNPNLGLTLGFEWKLAFPPRVTA